MPIRRLLITGVLLVQPIGLTAAERADGYAFHHENVLGTWLDLRVAASSEAAALLAQSRVLAEIDRLNLIFSTYRPDSQFSRWQQTTNQPLTVAPELLEVLAASQRWQRETGGAFNPAVEVLSRLWQRAAREQQVPAPADLADAVEQAAQTHWRLDPKAGVATRLSTAPLTLNAIAKGYIIDRGCQAALQSPEVTGVALNIGGDLAVQGNLAEQVEIADPFHPAENAPAMSRLVVSGRALATSGNYDRALVIAGRRHSHIIDPRSGQPVDQIASASVLAAAAMDADALATTFCVREPAESLRLADSLLDVECLIIDRNGARYQTAGWPEHADAAAVALAPLSETQGVGQTAAARQVQDKTASSNFELTIELEINRPEAARYERPYVAVWIEDAQGFPVRTVALWIKTSGSGNTWVPDLKRWFRGDLKRLKTDKTDLVVTRSSVTRPPGKHTLVWDGTDNQKKPLPPGNYTVMIEAAREHGTYQIIRQPVTLGDAPFETAVDGNLEIKSARLEYRPAKSAP